MADKLSFEFPDIKLLIGKTYMKMNKISGALVHFNKAIRFNPMLLEAYLDRGYAYYKKKNFEKAAEDWNHLINNNSILAEKARHYLNLLKKK